MNRVQGISVLLKLTAHLIAIVLLMSCLSGCAAQPVQRRSAFVPRVQGPSRQGSALERGQVRIWGEITCQRRADKPLGKPCLDASDEDISHSDDTELDTARGVLRRKSRPGTPSLFLPRKQLGGGVYFGLTPFVEVGVQGAATRLVWSKPNATDVLPIPDDSVDWLFTGGPGARLNLPIPGSGTTIPLSTIALLGEFNLTEVPQARWTCENCDAHQADVDPTEGADLPRVYYHLEGIQRQVFLLPKIYGQLSMRQLLGSRRSTHRSSVEFNVFVAAGVQRQVINRGHESTISRRDDSTLSGYWMGQWGGGIEFLARPYTFTLSWWQPFGQPRQVDFGPSATAQLGLVFN